MALSAAVLAGGASARMGRDKAWIELGGRTVIARVLSVLDAIAEDVFIVANDARYGTLGRRLIGDRVRGAGPLGGIATALAEAANEVVLISACDMPLQRESVWQALIKQIEDADAVVPVVGGRRHPLHGVYRRRCQAIADRVLAEGELRVGAFVERLRVREVGEAELRRTDPELLSFANLNTPADLEALRGRAD